MELITYSFKELLSTLGEKLDNIVKLMDYDIKIIEDPYTGVYIPETILKIDGVAGEHLIGYLSEDNEKLALYLIIFDDYKARTYTYSKEGVFKNRGKNIYQNSDTTIVDTSVNWNSFVIDDITGNGGKDSSPEHPIL